MLFVVHFTKLFIRSNLLNLSNTIIRRVLKDEEKSDVIQYTLSIDATSEHEIGVGIKVLRHVSTR